MDGQAKPKTAKKRKRLSRTKRRSFLENWGTGATPQTGKEEKKIADPC